MAIVAVGGVESDTSDADTKFRLPLHVDKAPTGVSKMISYELHTKFKGHTEDPRRT